MYKPLPLDAIALHQPVPVNVWDPKGVLLLRKGEAITSEQHRGHLMLHSPMVLEADWRAWSYSYTTELDRMVRDDAPLKRIAGVTHAVEVPNAVDRDEAGPVEVWTDLHTSLNSLLLAFALALFLVYIVMASQFESLLQPLLIMATVPLALVGVILVLWLGGIPVSIMVFLGLIILAGIVVNNAIVLIDYINTLRDRGLPLEEAISEAGRARLRPILMTTLTTVLGLVPMALGLGEGAEIRAPMAITVVVGLSASTLLTLVVIPTLYYLFPGKRGPTAVEAGTPAGEPVALPK